MTVEQEMDLWQGMLSNIAWNLARLEAGLSAIQAAQAELEEAGMFPAVPVEIWEPRPNTTHGEARYLKLSFPKGALPNGRRKLYIGCKEAKITRARQMASRRREWERLEKERARLDRFLVVTRAGLEREARDLARYQIPDDLGLGPDVAEAYAGPKEWIRPSSSGAEWNLDVLLAVAQTLGSKGEEEGHLPLCTCGVGDGSMLELHADDCAITQYARARAEVSRPDGPARASWLEVEE